ncbi:MAG: M23 family metallopeptidase [Alphaproteobacteria bacterium]
MTGGGAALALVFFFSVSKPYAADQSIAPRTDLEAEQGTTAAAGLWLEADNAAEAEQLDQTYRQTLKVGDGDTLMAMLVGAGADRRDAYDAIVAMSEVFKPRYLKPGQEISVTLRPSTIPEKPDTLISITLIESVERDILVRRGDDEVYVAEVIDHPLSMEIAAGTGVIEASLFLAGEAAGVPPGVLADLIQIYSFDVDFQRDIRKGDGFSVMYERYLDERGNVVRSGDILRASMTLSGKQRTLYLFVTAKGVTDYYDEAGKSARRTLMRTPINGARLSSGFGNRRHPILGFTKLHTGTDFAAPRGTPIYAAGNGTVELAGRKGGYGIYIRLRHNSTYKTAYAHMSGIARGVRRGKRVTQGQVIGYVGSTGQSTGNHLHYEVMRNGTFINSRRMRLPSGKALKGDDLETFQAARGESDQQLAALTGDAVQFAVSEDGETAGCGGPAGAC